MNLKWLIPVLGFIAVVILVWFFFFSGGSDTVSAEPAPLTDSSQVESPPVGEEAEIVASEETTESNEGSETLENELREIDELAIEDNQDEEPSQNTGLTEEIVIEQKPVTPPELQNQSPPLGATDSFSTDFNNHTVSYEEILSGGPPKDGIPAIDKPQFVSVDEADTWLEPQEPVILLSVSGESRAYPLQILMWHEIVNDVVGGEPVTVTFCPLCNTAIAFERTFDSQILDFGTTGRLRFSNLIMYDRQSETWWQQATGEGIAGKYAGQQLTFIPASIISWEDYKDANPEGLVLSRETGFNRSYGRNPYAGYDNINNSPFLYRGDPPPGQLLPMERVLTVEKNGEAVAYPYEVLQEIGVVNDIIDDQPIVLFWEAGTASALDSGVVATGRDVGAASTYSRVLDGETLTFTIDGNKIVDEQTGSIWNVLGQALEGELAGSQLEPIVSINHFWFSWAAFKPETRVYQAEVE